MWPFARNSLCHAIAADTRQSQADCRQADYFHALISCQQTVSLKIFATSLSLSLWCHSPWCGLLSIFITFCFVLRAVFATAAAVDDDDRYNILRLQISSFTKRNGIFRAGVATVINNNFKLSRALVAAKLPHTYTPKNMNFCFSYEIAHVFIKSENVL